MYPDTAKASAIPRTRPAAPEAHCFAQNAAKAARAGFFFFTPGPAPDFIQFQKPDGVPAFTHFKKAKTA